MSRGMQLPLVNSRSSAGYSHVLKRKASQPLRQI